MSYHGSSSSSSNARRTSSRVNTSQTPREVGVQRQAAPAGFHYMPDGSLMADSAMSADAPIVSTEIVTSTSLETTADVIRKSEPIYTPPFNNDAPYIGKCYNVQSYDACASNTAHNTMNRLYTDLLSDTYQAQFGLTTGPPNYTTITSSVPIVSTYWNGAGGVPGALPPIDWQVLLQTFLLFHKNWWLAVANSSALGQIGNSTPLGMPYRNGCSSLDGHREGWSVNSISTPFTTNYTLQQSQIPGHLPAYTGAIANPFPITTAQGGTNFHYQWWELQMKIEWTLEMEKCCACNETGHDFGVQAKVAQTSTPEKYIKQFDLDLSDLPAVSEERPFTITGDNGAEFRLEVKDNTTGYYYNFESNAFQVAQTALEQSLIDSTYVGSITFPAVTGGDDQYDVRLFTLPGTRHALYNEVRFGDGSLDVNNSTGSNSLVMEKVIYQYAALTLTMAGYSIDGTVAGTYGTDTISINRGKTQVKTAFSFTTTAGATAAYRILKQPVSNDILSFLEPVVGSAPIDLPGEDIYPAVSNTDTVDGEVAAGGKIVMDTNVADKMAVGDKITIATTDLTDTVNGAVTSGIKVVMDSNVATKMAVGDRITNSGVPLAPLFNPANIITVAALNPDGDNAKEFSMSEAVGLTDGLALVFTPKCNRELFTVAALNPDEDNAKEFSYVDSAGGTDSRFGVRDGATLSFSNRKNFSWPINNYADLLEEGMIVLAGANGTADTSVGSYRDSITIFPQTKKEKTITKTFKPALSTLAKKPTVVKGLVTVQEGQIVFNKQQVLALAGDTLKVGGYGENEILRVYGWEVKFTDLAIALTPPTTTTTEATSAHATIAVADREGIINTVSTVSGVGINPALADPTLTTGGGLDGAGDWVMNAVQTLESGVTLTVGNTGRIATITGNIEIVKAGYADQTLRFDIGKLLSTSAP